MCSEHRELIQQLAQTNDNLEHEREAYEREREILGLLVVELTRLSQAMTSVLERAKSRLAGVTPQGNPPPTPR